MKYESWRISYQDSEQAAAAAYRLYQMANDENAKLHGWLKNKSQVPQAQRIAEKANTELQEEILELRRHRRELLELIYNSAVGQVAMGYSVCAEALAQSAYSITGISMESRVIK